MIKALYYFLPALIANMVPVLVKRVELFNYPVHKKWFGTHKTVRGIFFAVLSGFIVYLLQYLFRYFLSFHQETFLIIGIPSTGVHSNGFSLIRYILKKKKIKLKKNKFLKKELMKPTKIYVKEILKLVDKKLINGCVNITGGGFEGNIVRILPAKLSAQIYLDKIKPKNIFKWLHSQGVSDKEMIRTFNCGIGFCIIIKPQNLKKIKKYFTKDFQPYVIGKIVNGKRKINLNGKIKW